MQNKLNLSLLNETLSLLQPLCVRRRACSHHAAPRACEGSTREARGLCPSWTVVSMRPSSGVCGRAWLALRRCRSSSARCCGSRASSREARRLLGATISRARPDTPGACQRGSGSARPTKRPPSSRLWAAVAAASAARRVAVGARAAVLAAAGDQRAGSSRRAHVPLKRVAGGADATAPVYESWPRPARARRARAAVGGGRRHGAAPVLERRPCDAASGRCCRGRGRPWGGARRRRGMSRESTAHGTGGMAVRVREATALVPETTVSPRRRRRCWWCRRHRHDAADVRRPSDAPRRPWT